MKLPQSCETILIVNFPLSKNKYIFGICEANGKLDNWGNCLGHRWCKIWQSTKHHTATLSPVTMSHCHTITLSHCHNFSLSHCHNVEMSPHHTVTLSQCRNVTMSQHHTVTLSHCRLYFCQGVRRAPSHSAQSSQK